MTGPRPQPGILDITAYVGGRSTAGEPGGRVIKLSSNESPLGPSPHAIEAYRAVADDLHRYPDGAPRDLRPAPADSAGARQRCSTPPATLSRMATPART